jgi:hypothetical protein
MAVAPEPWTMPGMVSASSGASGRLWARDRQPPTARAHGPRILLPGRWSLPNRRWSARPAISYRAVIGGSRGLCLRVHTCGTGYD